MRVGLPVNVAVQRPSLAVPDRDAVPEGPPEHVWDGARDAVAGARAVNVRLVVGDVSVAVGVAVRLREGAEAEPLKVREAAGGTEAVGGRVGVSVEREHVPEHTGRRWRKRQPRGQAFA